MTKTCISRDLLNHFLPNKDRYTCNWITNHIITSLRHFLVVLTMTRVHAYLIGYSYFCLGAPRCWAHFAIKRRFSSCGDISACA